MFSFYGNIALIKKIKNCVINNNKPISNIFEIKKIQRLLLEIIDIRCNAHLNGFF